MERYKCRFCFKSFVNGRALGGHMRSHMLCLSATRDRFHLDEDERPTPLSDESESGGLFPSSSASSSSPSDEDDDGDGHVGEVYGWRVKTKRSTRASDPELAFPVVDPGSVLLQDGESETESSRINPTRRRSKRTRKLGGLDVDHSRGPDSVKRPRTSQLGLRTEAEPLSSASDTTTEEDLAFCLMMLSRDEWKQKRKSREVQEDDNDDHGGEEEDDMDESEGCKGSRNRARGRYKCETCEKVFRSYQALGGHRASHKKNSACRTEHQRLGAEYEVGNVVAEKKTHECPICLRVFPSGQALGGHKRSHGIISFPRNNHLRIDTDDSSVTTKRRFIDLNLPAPTEDDETSQAEVSVVFDEC